jgi:DNA primase
MNNDNVEQVKSSSDIVAVIGSYIDLIGGGKWFRARCPFHNEKSPSFYVSPERGRYKCFGCGKGGDVLTFVQEIEHCTFPEALSLLADRAGIVLAKSDDPKQRHRSELYGALAEASRYYEQELSRMPSVGSYLTARGITPETSKLFGIGFAPDDWNSVSRIIKSKYAPDIAIDSGLSIAGSKGIYDRFRSRLMFPLRDLNGKIVGFSARLLQFPGRELKTEKPTSGKYINSPESLVYHKSEVLFGLSLAKYSIPKAGCVVVVEGQFDCVLAHQIGTTHTVALSGTALTITHAELLHRYTDHVILALDGDSAGIAAIGRSLGPLYQVGCTVSVIKMPHKQDPADIISKNPDQWFELLSQHQDYLDMRLEIMIQDQMSIRDRQHVIQQDLYPLVRLIANPIERDRVIQKIARVLDVASSSVQQDIARTQTPVSKPDTDSKVESGPTSKPLSKSAELAVGIIGYLFEVDAPYAETLMDIIRGDIPVITIQDLANMFTIQYDDAVCKVSIEYEDIDLTTIGKSAVYLVIQEYLKDTRDSLAHQLTTNPSIHHEYQRIVARIDELSDKL